MDSHLLIQTTLSDVFFFFFFFFCIMASCVSYIIGRNEQSTKLGINLRFAGSQCISINHKYGAAQYQVHQIFSSLAPERLLVQHI